MQIISKNLANTENLAISIAEKIKKEASANKKSATILALFGDLGTGKTTFTQSFAKSWGITETLNSPTFVIQRIYTLTDTVFQHLIHIDAYRLESGSELVHLGWKEIIEDTKNLIVIEWPEKVADILPDDMIKMHFTFIDENTREIKIEEKR